MEDSEHTFLNEAKGKSPNGRYALSNNDYTFSSSSEDDLQTSSILETILSVSLILVSLVLYKFSLQGCDLTFDKCLTMINETKLHHKLIFYILGSATCFSVSIFLMILNRKYLNKLTITLTVLLCLFVIFYDRGFNLSNHGGYNRSIWFLLSFVLVILAIVLKKLSTSFFDNMKVFLVLLGIVVVVFVIAYKKFENYYVYSCIGWENGFKGTKIDNGISCKITPPTICYEQIFNGFFDVSGFLKESCSTRPNDNFNLINGKLMSAKRIGYPRTETWDYLDEGHYNNFQYYTLRRLFDMDDQNVPESKKKNTEVIIEKEANGKAKASVKLVPDYFLAKKRLKTFEEEFKKDSISDNVLFFFIDSLSRVHFRRKLPKTWGWIEQFYNSDNTQQFESFQFLKYQGLGTWTNINMIPAMFGVSYNSYQRADYFLNRFQRNGYMTGAANTMCARELIDLDNSMTNFNWKSYDHELYAFFCDPNFSPTNHDFSTMEGPYSMRKKCLYGKSTAEWAIDYAKQFFTSYKDYPKFFRVDIIDAHEGTGEVAKYDDDLIFNFFEEFKRSGQMDNTLVIIVTDHNFNMPGPYNIFELQDWFKERTLPNLNFILNKKMKNFAAIRENLKHNEQVFATPYDLHATVKSISDPLDNRTLKGSSLFYNKLEISRGKESCDELEIKDEWCQCR